MHRSPFARRPIWICLTLAIILALLGSARWSVPAGAAPDRASGGTVTLVNVGGSLWDCAFNPWVSSDTFISNGFLYETMLYINPLNGHITPMLATGYRWSNGSKTLTMTMRKNVRWSDGKPFSAADVVYTFHLMKAHAALDGNALWTVLSDVKQHGNNVVFTFKHPAVPDFYYLAGQTFIVPKHIWDRVKDPVKFTDPHPVATGPVVLSTCTPQNITYVRNPHYWVKGEPKVAKVQVPAFLGNSAGNLELRTGAANWGCQFIPNIKAYYVSADPAHNHYWFPPGSDNDLYLNLHQYPLNIVKVRQAISLGINRSLVSKIGDYGYLLPSNQAGIVLPNYANWYDKSLAKQYNYAYNPQKAQKLLQQAGFKKGSNGYYAKNGKTLSLTILGVAGFTDWVAELAEVQRNLQAIGIDVKVENIGGDTQLANLQAGKFQIGYYYTTAGPSPYYELYNSLDGALAGRGSKSSNGNYERWKNAQTDKLLAAYASTTNSKKQHQAIDGLQKIMLQDVPVIPVLEGGNYYQYNDSQLVGWPTPSNPYMLPCDSPGMGLTITHLHSR